MIPFTFTSTHAATDRPAPPRAEHPVVRPTYAEPVAQMGRRRPDPRDAQVHAALDVPRLTITRMADVLGVPRATLEAYRLGTRRMPAAVRTRLATFLAAHADTMRQLSEALLAEPRSEDAAQPAPGAVTEVPPER
ncbi:MAG TPA: hypothetical protein VGD56_07945 [Gemmatirosa sp.]